MPDRRVSAPGAPHAAPHVQPKPSRASRRPLIATGGLILLAAIILAVLLPRGGGTPAPVSPSPPSSSSSRTSSGPATGALLRIDPATNKVAAQGYEVGQDPRAVAIGEGSVWVADPGKNSILRVDPATGKVRATIAIGQQPRGIAIGGVPGVWVAAIDQVWEIDPQTNHVVGMHNVGEATGAIAAGEGSVWVTLVISGLGRVDATTGLRDRGFDVGMILCSGCIAIRDGMRAVGGPWSGDHQRGPSQSVAAGLGSVWAVGAPPPSGPSSVWRIDPSTGSSIPIRAEFPLVGVAIGEKAVWAVGANGVVARIDPETNEVAKLIGTGNGATRVVVGLGAVWVLNPTLGTVTRIDPGTNAVVATIEVGVGATAIAAGGGSVWVTRTAHS